MLSAIRRLHTPLYGNFIARPSRLTDTHFTTTVDRSGVDLVASVFYGTRRRMVAAARGVPTSPIEQSTSNHRANIVDINV